MTNTAQVDLESGRVEAPAPRPARAYVAQGRLAAAYQRRAAAQAEVTVGDERVGRHRHRNRHQHRQQYLRVVVLRLLRQRGPAHGRLRPSHLPPGAYTHPLFGLSFVALFVEYAGEFHNVSMTKMVQVELSSGRV